MKDLELQVTRLEKKVSALVRTNMRVQLQHEDAISKLIKQVDQLRKALPHVSFGESNG